MGECLHPTVKYHYSHRHFTNRVAKVRQAASLLRRMCEQGTFSPKPLAFECKAAHFCVLRPLPLQLAGAQRLWGHPLDGEFGWGGTPVK